MLQEQETILRRIGNALRGQSEDITHKTLPKRWVELIHYLDEQEQSLENAGSRKLRRARQSQTDELHHEL